MIKNTTKTMYMSVCIQKICKEKMIWINNFPRGIFKTKRWSRNACFLLSNKKRPHKGPLLSLYLQDLTRYRDPSIWAHSLACGDFFFNSFPCGIFGVPPKTAIDAILASVDAILFTSHETSDTFGAHHQNFPEMMPDF